MGRGFELDGDLAHALRHMLAAAYIEWHAGPAPVVHKKCRRGIRIGLRFRGHAFFLAEAGHLLAADASGPILAGDHVVLHLVGLHDADGAQQFGALVAYGIRRKGGARFHRDRGHDLEQVVLDHVAQRSGLLIICPATFDTDRLRAGDLHIVDVAAVPERLKDAVAEAERQDVLDGLLPQVVVDTIHLALRRNIRGPRRSAAVRSRGRAQTVSR